MCSRSLMGEFGKSGQVVRSFGSTLAVWKFIADCSEERWPGGKMGDYTKDM